MLGKSVDRVFNLLKGQALKAELIRGSIGSVLVKATSVGLAFSVVVLLARSLGPSSYGVYSYVFALVSLIAIPAQCGLPNLVVRETAKARATENWSLMRGLWFWTNSVTTATSVTLILCATSVVWIFGSHFTDEQQTTFAWALLLVPLVALGNLRGAALRGLRMVVVGQLPEFALRPALLIVFVLVSLYMWPSHNMSSSLAMSLHVCAAGAAYIVGAVLLRVSQPREVTTSSVRTVRSKEWIASAIPLAFLAGMQFINQHTDILMLGIFANASDVGIYRVVAQISMLVVFGLQAVNMVVASHFAHLFEVGDIVRLRRLVLVGARISLLAALPVSLVLFLWGEPILVLFFGFEYRIGYIALCILTAGQLINAGVGSVGILLNMTGHERDTARGVAIAAVSNIVLNLLLIPDFGMDGAAVATAVSLAIWNLLLLRDVRRRMILEH